MEKPQEVFEELFLESLPPRTPESEKEKLLQKTPRGEYIDPEAWEAYIWFLRGRDSGVWESPDPVPVAYHKDDAETNYDLQNGALVTMCAQKIGPYLVPVYRHPWREK